MKYYQKDCLLDLVFPAHCPVCGQVLPLSKNRSFLSSRPLIHIPAIHELICKPCFFQLPFVLDAHCMICGRPLDQPLAERCGDCKRYPHVFSEARAVFIYKGTVRQALYQLKFGNRKEYSRFFSATMAQYLSDWIFSRHITAIVPIPLHKSRLKVRSYNQAGEIAIRLGEQLDLPVYPDLLIRRKATAAQKNLNRVQRMDNLANAFCINPKFYEPLAPDNIQHRLSKERILLVDDIYTTGSTADSAALVLRNAGCPSVFVAAAAVTG